MKLSVIIPSRNEEAILPATVSALYDILSKEKIEHELVVINDNSTDNTQQVLEEIKKKSVGLARELGYVSCLSCARSWGLSRLTPMNRHTPMNAAKHAATPRTSPNGNSGTTKMLPDTIMKLLNATWKPSAGNVPVCQTFFLLL